MYWYTWYTIHDVKERWMDGWMDGQTCFYNHPNFSSLCKTTFLAPASWKTGGWKPTKLPPSRGTNMCLLPFGVPAITLYCACSLKYDHTAVSSALAAHCISGEMSAEPCSSSWHNTKALLVLGWGVQRSRKWSLAKWIYAKKKKPLCIFTMMHMQILAMSLRDANPAVVRVLRAP